MTPINRQSYMAEISSLLGLITDEHTREVLIAKMERMFDAAEDEQKLISDIGSPTKVAVALIRYADNGVVTPEAAAVIETMTEDDPEQDDEFETIEALDEQPELLIPETENETAPEAPETPEEPAAEEADAAPAEAEEAPAPEAETEDAPETETPAEAPETEVAAPETEPEAEPEPEVLSEPEAEVLSEPEASETAVGTLYCSLMDPAALPCLLLDHG